MSLHLYLQYSFFLPETKLLVFEETGSPSARCCNLGVLGTQRVSLVGVVMCLTGWVRSRKKNVVFIKKRLLSFESRTELRTSTSASARPSLYLLSDAALLFVVDCGARRSLHVLCLLWHLAEISRGFLVTQPDWLCAQHQPSVTGALTPCWVAYEEIR